MRDVIEHPHFPNPEAILRLAQAAKTFDPALADPGGLVSQVPFESIPHFGSPVGWQRPVGPDCLRSQDDLVSHSGHNIARLDIQVKSSTTAV